MCCLCNGTGWKLVGDNTVAECECGIRQKQILENKLKFADIPETYKGITFKDITVKYYHRKESRDKLKEVADLVKWYLLTLETNMADGKGLYFWSKTKGSGKTMMVTALANELVNKYGKYVKFATSLDILDEIRSTYNRRDSDETERGLLEDLVTADILVIDDFGTERATDWAGEKFYQIVNKRYINKKVTFFTSNYDLATLKYDDRITNRIRERSYIAAFPEESVRDVKANIDNQMLKERVKNET